MPRRKMDYEVFRKLGVELPDVEDATSDRGAALKIRGRLFACQAINKSAEPRSLMVRVGAAERDRLLAAAPDVYYMTDHYAKHACVLVRLDRISRRALRELLQSAWRFAMGAA